MKKSDKIIHDGDYFPKAMLEKWKKKMKEKKSKVGRVVKAK
jgi:hypothetical protein